MKLLRIACLVAFIASMLPALASPHSVEAADLGTNLRGRILLQVESAGEAWYVHPDTRDRYYLGRPDDAFKVMREQGVGIKHSELQGYLKGSFPARLGGKIMLDVEAQGQAYYVHPTTLKGHYLGRPDDAFKVMREQGLGITNKNLNTIRTSPKSARVISGVERARELAAQQSARAAQQARPQAEASKGISPLEARKQAILMRVNTEFKAINAELGDMEGDFDSTPGFSSDPDTSMSAQFFLDAIPHYKTNADELLAEAYGAEDSEITAEDYARLLGMVNDVNAVLLEISDLFTWIYGLDQAFAPYYAELTGDTSLTVGQLDMIDAQASQYLIGLRAVSVAVDQRHLKEKAEKIQNIDDFGFWMVTYLALFGDSFEGLGGDSWGSSEWSGDSSMDDSWEYEYDEDYWIFNEDTGEWELNDALPGEWQSKGPLHSLFAKLLPHPTSSDHLAIR